MHQGTGGGASILLLLLLLACQAQTFSASAPPIQDTLSHHQPHRGADGLIGAMGSYVTDLGMHMLHLMLSGPQYLMLEDRVPSGARTSAHQSALDNVYGAEVKVMHLTKHYVH